MGRQRFNIHTHTARCGHADGTDVQYINSAIDAGFQILGFSEHIPFEEIRIKGARMFMEQKDEYLLSMRKLQQQFKGKIEIKVGFEVEYLEDYLDYLKQVKEECDYLILGQHLKYVHSQNEFYDYDCYCSDEDLFIYVEQIEAALQHDLVTYVAHPDYFMQGRRVFSKGCKEVAHRIAKASLEYDIPLEINLNGFRYGKKHMNLMRNQVFMRNVIPIPLENFGKLFLHMAVRFYMVMMRILLLLFLRETEKC